VSAEEWVPEVGIVRYLPDGRLDASFSGDGKLTTSFRETVNGEIRYSNSGVMSVLIQPNGRIIIAGSTAQEYNFRAMLARCLPDGRLDATFGGDGKVVVDERMDPDVAGGITGFALQPDGKILIAGRDPDGSIFSVMRLRSNGNLDATFSGDGIATANGYLPGNQVSSSLCIQQDGKIILAGQYGSWTGRSDGVGLELLRFNTNGSLDRTYGNSGVAVTPFEVYRMSIAGTAIQPDDKVVVASIRITGEEEGEYKTGGIALARYSKNGVLDQSFGQGGLIVPDTYWPWLSSMAVQPRTGRIVVAGGQSDQDRGPYTIMLARYHAITCGGVVVTRIGTAGNDIITGTSGHDVVFAFGGNDVIAGAGGNDMLCGGSGDDTIRGGSGDDVLRGNQGMDTCMGGAHVQGDETADCEDVTGVP